MSDSIYPPVPFYFRVDIIGKQENLGFSEVSGLEVKMDTVEIIEGGENDFVHRVPGRVKYENITLKRGMRTEEGNAPIIKWCNDILSKGTGSNFNIQTATVVVKLLNEMGDPSATWIFEKAYPVRWKVGDLNSTDDSNVLIEEIELCYQKFSRSLNNLS